MLDLVIKRPAELKADEESRRTVLTILNKVSESLSNSGDFLAFNIASKRLNKPNPFKSSVFNLAISSSN
jgi:hypothetical protein